MPPLPSRPRQVATYLEETRLTTPAIVPAWAMTEKSTTMRRYGA
ncbi:hypothetical protein [Brevundimonas bullata]